MLSSANPARQDTARLSTTVALVGRLVDILAAFRRFDTLTPNDAPRLQAIADQIAKLQQKIRARNGRQVIQPLRTPSDGPLILLGLEQTLDLLRMSLSPAPGQSFTLDQINPAPPTLLKPDAFHNPEHLNFALRGCLASILCYFIFNAVFWPGLNTSLFTCVVTAVTSIGSSRQKQLLRFSGALFGGVVLGIGSQVLILPMLDTIAGFTVMFAAVTAVAAWILTSSPRLSYFGNQLALAFYLIQLHGPSPQTNLAIARDNIMGIMLGLVMMWLVFETLGSKPAVQVMRELFAENLHLMAEYGPPLAAGEAARPPEDPHTPRKNQPEFSRRELTGRRGSIRDRPLARPKSRGARPAACLATSAPFPLPPGDCTVAVPAAGLSAGSACSRLACVDTLRR